MAEEAAAGVVSNIAMQMGTVDVPPELPPHLAEAVAASLAVSTVTTVAAIARAVLMTTRNKTGQLELAGTSRAIAVAVRNTALMRMMICTWTMTAWHLAARGAQRPR